MKTLFLCAATLTIGTASFAQAPPAGFEVASIRLSNINGSEQVVAGSKIDGAQVKLTGLSLVDMLGMATNLRRYQIVGPDWLPSDRFDVAAKLSAGANAAQVPAMIEALVRERFGMMTHREKRDFPVYALVVGKAGTKLRESDPDPAGSAVETKDTATVAISGGRNGTSINFGGGSIMNVANNRFDAKKLTMPSFAEALGRFMDKPVVDMSGMTGQYDFTLEFDPNDFNAMIIHSALAAGVSLPPQALRLLDTASGDSIFSEIQKLGLKLESRKAAIEVMVVDHIERKPTAN